MTPNRPLSARAAACSLGILLAAAAAPAASPYREGEAVVIAGIVTDGQGTPLPQLTMSLEAWRSVFSLRSFRREKRDARTVSSTTNERGEYSLSWPWSDYYTSFEVQAGVPVRKGEVETTQVLSRVDISRRITHGSPVVVALAIEDTRFLTSLRAFLAGMDSEDEKRVYQALGKPDQVDTVESAGRSEATWWYFEAGKAYRFRDGKLVQVEPFDPVKRF